MCNDYAREIEAARVIAEAPSAPAGTSHPVRLTPREREIAALLRRGHTDRQIADALYITPGTVGVHVHHILRKLGLRSRTQVTGNLAAPDMDAAAS